MPELAMEVRSSDVERREIVGMVAPDGETSYLVPDPGGERLVRGCFAKTIAENGDRIPLYCGHDHKNRRYGTSKTWEQLGAGLVGTFGVNPGPEGDRLLAEVRDGYWPALSVGFVPVRRDRARDGAYEIREAKLHEVSLVGMGAYVGAEVLAVRAPDPVIFERFHNPPTVNLAPYPTPWVR